MKECMYMNILNVHPGYTLKSSFDTVYKYTPRILLLASQYPIALDCADVHVCVVLLKYALC